MSKSRLEAFTDAVIAIIMTILVLGLKRPDSADFAALWALRHAFLAYFISFATLAIYWNNPHHLFQASEVVSGKILWWNIMILFCLSMFPFTTAWVGDFLYSHTAETLYGILMLLSSIGWLFLNRALLQEHREDSILSRSLSGSKKSVFFTIGIVSAGLIIGWFWPPIVILSCLISLIPWVIPYKQIEKRMRSESDCISCRKD